MERGYDGMRADRRKAKEELLRKVQFQLEFNPLAQKVRQAMEAHQTNVDARRQVRRGR